MTRTSFDLTLRGRPGKMANGGEPIRADACAIAAMPELLKATTHGISGSRPPDRVLPKSTRNTLGTKARR
jgi:hypothetical protein